MHKKLFYVVSTAMLCLLLVSVAPVYAQDEQHAAQSEEKKDQQEDKAAKPDAKQDQENKQKEAHPDKTLNDKTDKSITKDEQSKTTTKGTQKTQVSQQKAGQIPEDKFHASFGPQHTFVVNRPVIVNGAPRFQVAGYWFVMAQPWPAGWAYTEPVYVDYIGGGYYLLCPAHPGVQISINVVL